MKEFLTECYPMRSRAAVILNVKHLQFNSKYLLGIELRQMMHAI